MGQTEIISGQRRSSTDALQTLPNSVATYPKTYEDGYVSVWHDHPRHQLVYAVQGLMMAQADGVAWAVPEGTGLIVPAGVKHEIRMIGVVRLQSLYVAPAIDSASAMDDCKVVAITPLLAALIDELCKMDNPWPLSPRAFHLSQLILIELHQAVASPLALPFPEDRRLRHVCDALIADPAISRTIDQWADEIGMSRRSFTRRFQLETGLSFGIWSQRLRCQVALRALARGEDIDRIAFRLGYANRHSLQAMMRRRA